VEREENQALEMEEAMSAHLLTINGKWHTLPLSINRSVSS
jgi:hypothetical protein